MKNLYRIYKISKITNDSISDIEKEIIEFILDKIKDLSLFIDDEGRHNYMNSDGKFIFRQDEKTDRLLVRYYGFWEVLEKKYLLKYNDIQVIIKGMVEESYKMKVGKPPSFAPVLSLMVEESYKMKVGTPTVFWEANKYVVEEAYKIIK